MAGTGIILRKDTKENLIQDPPIAGELVYSTDTFEIGFLGENYEVKWSNFPDYVAQISKLDGIEENANNYVLPVAGVNLGGIKSGTDISIDPYGNVTVKNDSHSHGISTITGLENYLNSLQNSIDNGDQELAQALQDVIYDVNGKQEILIAGENIKTINGVSLLESGDLSITSHLDLVDNELIYTNIDGHTDNFLITTSVAGKTGAVTLDIADVQLLQQALDDKQDSLESGVTLKSINGKSLLGTGDIDLRTDLQKLGNVLRYVNIDGTVQTIDLSMYLDDTNLSRLTSGQYIAETNVLRFTRDDETYFDVDASVFFDDTNLVTSVSGKTGAINLTIDDVQNLQTELDSKQNILIAGNNIKTLNGQTLLGSGNYDLFTSLIKVGNELRYTNIDGSVQTVDLTMYLDDTNLSRLVSGEYVQADNVLRFKRDDDTTFDVDASMFFDDTNIVTSVAGKTGSIILEKADISDFIESDYAQQTSLDAVVDGTTNITYDNSNTDLTSTTLKDAIDEIRNTDYGKTLAFVNKTFASDEEYDITLSEAKSIPTVTVAKENPQIGISNDRWYVDTNTFDFGNYALDTTIQPSSSLTNGTFTLGSGSFTSEMIGMRVIGNGGVAMLIDAVGNYELIEPFNDSLPIQSGDWRLEALEFSNNKIMIAGFNSGNDVTNPTNFGSLPLSIPSDSGLIWSNDGSKLYVISNGTKQYYNANTAFNINDLNSTAHSITWDTASQQTTFSVCLRWNNDGTKVYTSSNSGGFVLYEWNLDVPYELESGVTFSQSVIVAGAPFTETSVQGFNFSEDGTKLFVVGSNDLAKVSVIPMTAWNILTLSATSTYKLDTFTETGAIGFYGIEFSLNGDNLFVLGSNEKIYQYSILENYDLTTTSYHGVTSVSFPSGSKGLLINFTGSQIATTNTTIAYMQLGQVNYVENRYLPAITSHVGGINTDFWTDINSVLVDEDKNTQNIYYAISDDLRQTWSIAHSGYGVRNIVRNNNGTWEFNNASTNQDFIKNLIKEYNVSDISLAPLSNDRTLIALNYNNYGSYIVVDHRGEIIQNEYVFNVHESRNISASKLGTDKVIISFENGGNGYNGSYIIIGDDAQPTTTIKIFNNVVTSETTSKTLANNNVMIMFRDNDDNGKFIVIDENTNIVITEKTIGALPTNIDGVRFANNNFFAVFNDGANNEYGTRVILNTAGNVVYGPTVFNTGATIDTNVSLMSNGNALIVFADGTNSNYGTFMIVSPTNTVVKAKTVFSATATSNIKSVTLNSGKTMIVFADDTNGIGKMVIIDTNGNVVTTSTFNTSSINNLAVTKIEDGNISLSYNDFEYSYYPVINMYSEDGTPTELIGFNLDEEWVPTTINEEYSALEQAMALETNRMDGIQASSIADWSQEGFVLNTDLDLAVILNTSLPTITPVYNGIILNYDSNASFGYVALGTDYDIEQLANEVIRITSYIDGNLKIRIV